MQEFSSVSVSSYEAAGLVEQLNQQAAAGWEVVSIVAAGSSVIAYLHRTADATAVDAPAVTEITEVSEVTETTEPVAAPVESSGWAATTIVDTPASDTPAVDAPAADAPAAADVAPTAAATPAAAAPGGAPADWYADPSGRFEQRYWDGGQWTEHVARGGQRYTDPPVA